MPYRFELRDASLTDALRRLMQEELVPVQGHLAVRGLAPDTVHDIRKRVKKCRALLRLLKPGLQRKQHPNDGAVAWRSRRAADHADH